MSSSLCREKSIMCLILRTEEVTCILDGRSRGVTPIHRRTRAACLLACLLLHACHICTHQNMFDWLTQVSFDCLNNKDNVCHNSNRQAWGDVTGQGTTYTVKDTSYSES